MVAEEDDLLTSQGGSSPPRTHHIGLFADSADLHGLFLSRADALWCCASPVVAGIAALVRHNRTHPGGFPAMLGKPQALCFQGVAGYGPTSSPFSDGRLFSLHYVDSRKRTRSAELADSLLSQRRFPFHYGDFRKRTRSAMVVNRAFSVAASFPLCGFQKAHTLSGNGRALVRGVAIPFRLDPCVDVHTSAWWLSET